MTNDQLNQFYLSFNSIDTLIEGFKLSIPAPAAGHLPQDAMREMLVVHALVHVATIQLHNPFVVDIDASSRLRVLASARAIVAHLAQVPVGEFGFVDPIMGVRLLGLLLCSCPTY
jgi:hypothetical protein